MAVRQFELPSPANSSLNEGERIEIASYARWEKVEAILDPLQTQPNESNNVGFQREGKPSLLDARTRQSHLKCCTPLLTLQ